MGEVHLDTSILIDLLEKEPIEKLVKLTRSYELKISSIVYFEFMVGAYRLKRRELKELVTKFVEVLPVTVEVADKAAEIEAELMRKGTPLDPRPPTCSFASSY